MTSLQTLNGEVLGLICSLLPLVVQLLVKQVCNRFLRVFSHVDRKIVWICMTLQKEEHFKRVLNAMWKDFAGSSAAWSHLKSFVMRNCNVRATCEEWLELMKLEPTESLLAQKAEKMSAKGKLAQYPYFHKGKWYGPSNGMDPCWSQDGKKVFYCWNFGPPDKDQLMFMWFQMDNGQHIRHHISRGWENAARIACSSNLDTVVVSTKGGTLIVYGFAGGEFQEIGRSVRNPQLENALLASNFVHSQDGRNWKHALVPLSKYSGCCLLKNPETSEVRYVCRLSCMAFSPDGQIMVNGVIHMGSATMVNGVIHMGSARIEIYTISREHSTFSCGQTVIVGENPVTEMKFSPDGKTLITFSMIARTITLWHVENNRITQTTTVRHSCVGPVTCNSNLSMFAVSNYKNSMVVYNSDWEIVHEKVGLFDGGYGLSFSPNGKYIAAGCLLGDLHYVCIYKVPGYEEMCKFHSSACAHSIIWSPQSDQIMVINTTHKGMVYDIPRVVDVVTNNE